MKTGNTVVCVHDYREHRTAPVLSPASMTVLTAATDAAKGLFEERKLLRFMTGCTNFFPNAKMR